ncbi:MAG: HD domain-containing protein [bacterium]|nr:HD domain-containing protein [bacterium]MDD5354726.1 HD domain-containing protein [bacterium]
MYRGISINLFNLVLSFSDALDLASPELVQHQIRTAYIAWELARKTGMGREDIENLVIAALIHDVGALTAEEKINLHEADTIMTEPHCILGESLLKDVPVFAHAAKIIRLHHHKWQDWVQTVENPLTAQAQILNLADYVERSINRSKYILHQDRNIAEQVSRLAATDIQVGLIDIFKDIAKREDFWLTVTSPRIYSLLYREATYRSVVLDLSDLKEVSKIFRNLIDFRSRFTSTHSAGVSTSAGLIAKYFGLTEWEIELMEITGNLHDLGKLMVPNTILEKQDKLTTEEFAIMKQHTYFTYTTLCTVKGLEEIAEWAAFHHEKLDGSGYPFHLRANKLSMISRIMAVADIFTALTEDRPYRAGMTLDEAMAIIKNLDEKGMLDHNVAKVLEHNLADISASTKQQQARAREFYESVFPANN